MPAGNHISDMTTLILDLRQASQARVTHFTLLGRLALELDLEIAEPFSCLSDEAEDEVEVAEGAGCSGLKPAIFCGRVYIRSCCY